jgi:hypothetical protein
MSSSKNQKRRDKTKDQAKMSKQSMLIDPYFNLGTSKSNKTDKPNKEIVIQEIANITKENEIEIKIAFSLLPSKASFSKVNLDLYFEEQLLNSTILDIPQGSLTTDSFEFPQILDMKGMVQGRYTVRIEMYEPWSNGEKLNYAFKEMVIAYVPQKRESRYVRVPTVKSVAGNDLTIVTSSIKTLYHDIEKDQKREGISNRDIW